MSKISQRMFACLAAAALAAGCAHSLPQEAGDPAGVIAVADTDVGLAGRLNTQMQALGWRLVAYLPGERAGLPGPVPDDLAERARYRLELRAERSGHCPSHGPHYLFDVRLVDNRDGTIVVRDQGKGCEIDIAEEFARIMRQRGPKPPAPDAGG